MQSTVPFRKQADDLYEGIGSLQFDFPSHKAHYDILSV